MSAPAVPAPGRLDLAGLAPARALSLAGYARAHGEELTAAYYELAAADVPATLVPAALSTSLTPAAAQDLSVLATVLGAGACPRLLPGALALAEGASAAEAVVARLDARSGAEHRAGVEAARTRRRERSVTRRAKARVAAARMRAEAAPVAGPAPA